MKEEQSGEIAAVDWESRCAALYQVIGALASYCGAFGTQDIEDALDVASGDGDLEALLPWPKDAAYFESMEKRMEDLIQPYAGKIVDSVTSGSTAAPADASPSAGQWIAVTERLPNGEYVLAWDENYSHPRYGQYSRELDAWLFLSPSGKSDAVKSYRVNYWQPLPAPPLSDIKGEK